MLLDTDLGIAHAKIAELENTIRNLTAALELTVASRNELMKRTDREGRFGRMAQNLLEERNALKDELAIEREHSRLRIHNIRAQVKVLLQLVYRTEGEC